MSNLDNQNRALYLITLIPPSELRMSIKALKEEMKSRYHAKHALKSPAHITLQMPFRRRAEGETHLISTLKLFAANQRPFTIELNGFDVFAPRVIFIDIQNPQPIIQLHSQLKKYLLDKLDFLPDEVTQSVHPHITIATRDLTEFNFHNAWPEFKNRAFVDKFHVTNLSLLKHNGQRWEILQHLPFLDRDEKN